MSPRVQKVKGQSQKSTRARLHRDQLAARASPPRLSTALWSRSSPASSALTRALRLREARSPVMLPIPGTSGPKHLEENWAARSIHLEAEEVESIAAAARAQ